MRILIQPFEGCKDGPSAAFPTIGSEVRPLIIQARHVLNDASTTIGERADELKRPSHKLLASGIAKASELEKITLDSAKALTTFAGSLVHENAERAIAIRASSAPVSACSQAHDRQRASIQEQVRKRAADRELLCTRFLLDCDAGTVHERTKTDNAAEVCTTDVQRCGNVCIFHQANALFFYIDSRPAVVFWHFEN